MADAPLGYRNVPEGQCGWDGNWGTVPVQGPIPRPEWYVDKPRPEETAFARVVTEWTCPHCGADNDVWGEGAVGSWMECGGCLKYAFLEMM